MTPDHTPSILPASAGFSARSRAAAAIVAAWLAVGLLSASQYYLGARTAGHSGSWWLQVLREIPTWQVWSLLTPFAFFVARRFPLTPGRLARHLPVHFAAALGCAAVYLLVWAWWTKAAMPSYDQPVAALFWGIFSARFNVAILLYGGIIGVYYALVNLQRLRAREVEAARAQAESAIARAAVAGTREELARARLQALRSQLHPHFLFNTLHSIASLMDEDVPTARRLIARLSDLLRTTLDLGAEGEVALADEIEFLEQYLDIERVRFGSRLRVEYAIAADTRNALVPPLVLQPLVENAVRHGIAPLERGGTIWIKSWREDGGLYIEVADNGRGIESPGRPAAGIGLRNTRERLEHTYGAEHSITVRSLREGGVSARIRIPHRDGRETQVGAPQDRAP